MEAIPVFKGLTRDVTIGGLPQMYFVMMMFIVVMPLIFWKSILLSLALGGIIYPLLRLMVAHDPKLAAVFVVATQTTALKFDALSEKGFTYRA
ncbi:MAG: VirB3 family type IV secretion system protein [Pseudomonadota bacterium]